MQREGNKIKWECEQEDMRYQFSLAIYFHSVENTSWSVRFKMLEYYANNEISYIFSIYENILVFKAL